MFFPVCVFSPSFLHSFLSSVELRVLSIWDVWFVHLFFQSVTYLFIFLTRSFAEHSFKMLMKFNLSISFYVLCFFFLSRSKKSLSKPLDSEDFPMLFSKNLTIIEGVRPMLIFLLFFLLCHWLCNWSSAICWRTFFPSLDYFCIFVKN